MKRSIPVILLFACFCCFLQCKTMTDNAQIEPSDEDPYARPEQYNIKFVGFDSEINNPEKDRRSYYRIFIDKIEEGRTTTGLESQQKVFETYLEPNRHLIMVEKWILDKNEGKYIKLNNIDQPKPNFTYFDVPENRIVLIKMISLFDMTTSFQIEYARK